MRQAIASGLVVGLLAWIAVPGIGSSVGLTAGFDPTGLWVFGAVAELSVAEMADVRMHIGFATQEIAGLMLVGVSILPHWVIPPIDPFAGIGLGVALTPPPFSTGFVVEGVVGVRLVPASVVSILLQARYLARWTGEAWTSGPVFEGGILVHF